MKLIRVLLAIVLFSILLAPTRLAGADAGPEPDPNLGGLQPFGYIDTEVQMIYERVEIDVASEPTPFDYEERFANVTAWFVMRNRGSEAESMKAVFPLKSFDDCYSNSSNVIADSFEVYVDGVLTPYTDVVTDHPHKAEHPSCETMKWAGFDVTFPVDQDVLIKVNYKTNFEGWNVDSLEYTLETGAGWKGPIERGYIIVRFPYTISNENILESSVPGYQILYNEIFWSFQNLEPTAKDNIKVTFIPPDTWKEIISLRQIVKQNPQTPDAWLRLADIYRDIAHGDTKEIVYKMYMQKIDEAYREAIAANPDNAELPGSYARYLAQSGWNLYYDNAGNLVNGIIEYNKNQALFYINKALALDSTNQAAMSALDDLYFMVPGLTYTPPPTIPPTATPLVSATPTFKPTETITPRGYTTSTSWPTETKAPTKSPRPSATSSNTPIPTDAPVTITPLSTEQPKNSNTSMFYAGFFAVFFTGLGIGYFVRRSKKEQ